MATNPLLKNFIDLSGISVIYSNSDGVKKVVTDTNHLVVNGYNSKKIGTQTVTVKYGAYSDMFEVTVRYNWWQWIIYVLFPGFFKI